jgi:UDP-glucose 4-epimerase
VKILVTGGAGFIGSHLVRRLIKDRVGSVVVLDNFHRGQYTSLADCVDEIGFVRGDVRDPLALHEALQGIEVVYHLAAQSSVISAGLNADYTYSTNVGGSFQLLQAAKASGVRRVVFASSREVYGDPRHLPVPETAPLKPKNLYGASKAAGEALCSAFGSSEMETVIVRLANVYGPGDTDRVLPIFIERAMRGEPLVLYGGRQVLDFVWIETVVDSLLKVGLGDLILEPLNIGSGKGTTIHDVSQRVTQMTGCGSRIEIAPPRQTEVTRFVADVTRARKVIGLPQPADPLFGLAQMVGATRQQRPLSAGIPVLASIA